MSVEGRPNHAQGKPTTLGHGGAVGPVVLFDPCRPATIAPDVNHDVGPPPRTGLGSVSALFDGRQGQRCSVGSVALIEPGA